MEREVKITIFCPIEIDDGVDVTNATELYDAEIKAIYNDLISTEYLGRCYGLRIDDVTESEVNEDEDGIY